MASNFRYLRAEYCVLLILAGGKLIHIHIILPLREMVRSVIYRTFTLTPWETLVILAMHKVWWNVSNTVPKRHY